MNWISVDDRLPECKPKSELSEFGVYIAYAPSMNIQVRVKILRFYYDKGNWAGASDYWISKMTHWALPPLPEDEK